MLSIFAIDSSASFLFLVLSCFLFPLSSLLCLFLPCLGMWRVNSSIPVTCHCCFSQSPVPVSVLTSRWISGEGRCWAWRQQGEATEFAAIALGDQIYVMNVLNTHCCWWEKHLLFSFRSLGSPSDIFAHCVFSASNYAIHRKSPSIRDCWVNNCLHKSAAGLKMLHNERSQLHLLVISCWLNYVKMLRQWVHWNLHCFLF